MNYNNNFRCDLCGVILESAKELKKHEKVSHEN